MNRLKNIDVCEETLQLTELPKIEEDKVIVMILDGFQGKAKAFEAVHHGKTIIETAKGKAFKVSFDEGELF